MRLPRMLFTLRGMMLSITLIALALGVIVSVRTHQARRSYLRAAKRFAESETWEREMQKYFELRAKDTERSIADDARQAYRSLRSLRVWSNQTRYAARHPGSSGGYDDPSVDAIIALKRIGIEHAISTMTQRKESAAQYRADAALAAKRATYFSGLKQKYKYGVSRPWVPIEPDPPPPK